MEQRRIRLAALVAALMALTLVAGACSSGDGGEQGDGSGGPGSGDVVPGSAQISIADLAFEPTTLSVASGGTDISITNADTVNHTFTLDDGSVDQAIAAGENETASVDLSESMGFHCEIHQSMTGTLQVV